jgi:hypothetical protein
MDGAPMLTIESFLEYLKAQRSDLYELVPKGQISVSESGTQRQFDRNRSMNA